MAIGTGNITLQEVTTEIYGDTNAGRNLVTCFADATGTFNATYEGSKDRLSNFKGYSQAAASTSYSSSSGTGSDACGITKNQTYYHNGVNALPVVNDTCYSNSGMTTTLAANHYSVGGGPGEEDLTINSSGVVTAVSGCGDPDGGGGGGFGGGGF